MASSSCDPGEKTLSSPSAGMQGERSEAAPKAVEQPKPYKLPVINKKLKRERICTAKERISKMPPCTAGKRSSIYRGVTRHRWTGRYEAHLWDKTTWNQNQNKKGKQVYLGAYDDEEAAARAYDLAALKYWGTGTIINFPVSDYERDLEEMKNASREEYLASLRRKSSGFSKCISRHPELGLCDDQEREANEKRIDLTGYIKWWGNPKGVQEKKVGVNKEDEGPESKRCDWASKPTNPYEMPSLGVPKEHKWRGSGMSALAILSESVAFNNLKERVMRKLERQNDAVDDREVGKEERCDEGMGIGHVLQRSWYQLAPCFGDSDNLVDPVMWPALVVESPSVSSHELDGAKTECASIFSYFQQDK